MAELIFTTHIRQLHNGETPDDSAYLLMENMLRKATKSSSPSQLNINGKNWQDPEALSELLNACYVYSIVDRLKALYLQLDKKPNVEGLVKLNIDRFLNEQRRKANPLRFGIGQTVKEALKQLTKNQRLKLPRDTKFPSNFVVTQDPAKQVLSKNKLAELIKDDSEWDDLVQNLTSTTVITEVGERLLRVLEVGGFQVRDVISVLVGIAAKLPIADVKTGQQTDWVADQDGNVSPIRTIFPDVSYMDSVDSVEARVDSLITRVKALDNRNQKVKKRLECFLVYLREETCADLRDKDRASKINEKTTQRDLAEQLGISTSMLNEDIQQLRELYSDEISGRSTE